MKLKELEIQNYGCISEDALKIQIDEIIVLIGKNNSGKSTVLSAYQAFETNMQLDEQYFHKYNKEKPVIITGIFSDLTPKDKKTIGGKWAYQDKDHGECIKYRYVWEIPGRKGKKQSYNFDENVWTDNGVGGWDSLIMSCIPKSLCINPLDNPARLEETIIEILTNAVKESSAVSNSKINELVEDLNKIAEEIQTEISDDLCHTTGKIAENMSAIFPDVSVSLKPQVGGFKPDKLIATGSHVRIQDKDGYEYPLSKQGSGLQRTFLWSAIQVLADNGKLKRGRTIVGADQPKILLVEEPESFLHPPAIRKARETLYKLASLDGWQVMITTHSPIFIDVSKSHTTIVRIDKNSKGNTMSFSTNKASFDVDERNRLKMIRNCNPEVNEFFFADKVLLVEGETEHSIFEELKPVEEIQIVNCFGKGNIPTFQKILNHFQLPYIVLHDSDSPKAKRKDKFITNAMWSINKRIYDEATKCSSNIVLCSVPDLERAFFNVLQTGDKPFAAITRINEINFQQSDTYNLLKSIVNFDLKLLSEQSMCIKKDSDYQSLVEEYVRKNKLDNKIWDFE